ncbi:MAG: hypothetical protein M5U15_04770 [Kiritimatiellae bacterium]|nr:hypothetical protein [Kiritimatiellia bacterium]
MKRYRLALCLALAPFFFCAAPVRALVATPTEKQNTVYVIPVKGMIEPALVYVMRRGVQEAERQNAAAVILEMDTLGGRLDAATDIVRLMQSVRVPTYTFVEKNAISAGAIIALSTKKIYMAPGSVIGDAMPIMMTPTGGHRRCRRRLKRKQFPPSPRSFARQHRRADTTRNSQRQWCGAKSNTKLATRSLAKKVSCSPSQMLKRSVRWVKRASGDT